MTTQDTIEAIKEDVQNIVAPKPANVPAQTKPHYWLYKQGKDVWNRWAREAFFDENGKDDGRIDRYIEDAKKNQNQDIIKLLEEFKLLKPLSEDEKVEIEGKMNENYSDWLTSQGLQKINNIKLPEVTYIIGFSATNWQDWVDFRNFIFTSYVDFSSAVFENGVSFELTTFSASTSFHLATFSNRAGFNSATFSRMTSFNLAIFSSDTFFDSASFSSYANFNSASFKSIYLKKTVFVHDVSFEGTKFESVPKVSGMEIEGLLDLTDAQWPDVKAKESKPNSDALQYSQIKRRMQELHLHDHEIFFFRKELLCRAEASKRKSEALRKPREIALEFDKSNWRHDGSIKNKKYYKFLDENSRTAQLIYLYDAVCKCGDSVARPSLILFNLFYVMIFIYPLIAGKMSFEHIKGGLSGEALLNGLYLSTTHTLLFLLPNKSTYDRVFTNLYGEQQSFEFLYSLLSGFQTFISMALIFLIGFCLRNYLRIK